MFRFAVIAEPFAVIGHDGDNGTIEEGPSLQPIEKAPDELVGVGDLAVVRLRHRVRRRRRIRRVRLVKMKEREEFLAGVTVNPRGQRVDRHASIALGVRQRFAGAGGFDRIIEKIEAAVDAGLMAQHIG